MSDGSINFKLIDLGYCKELDQSSLASSFVGTLQYLAPELFISKAYTSAVDNWSFGLLAHEAITGKRPFLPLQTPAQWIPLVSKKSSDDICAVIDNKTGKVFQLLSVQCSLLKYDLALQAKFEKEISLFNNISSTLKHDVERCLRMALEWDPKKVC